MPTAADGWTDFNDIENGTVRVLYRHCINTPHMNKPFSVGDGEGNWCQGVVVGVGDTFFTVKLDLVTFRNVDDHPRFVRGNPRIADLLSDPTIAAEVRKIENDIKRREDEDT